MLLRRKAFGLHVFQRRNVTHSVLLGAGYLFLSQDKNNNTEKIKLYERNELKYELCIIYMVYLRCHKSLLVHGNRAHVFVIEGKVTVT